MSMPMLAVSPMEPADRPALRLADDVEVEPEAAGPTKETAPKVTASGEADVSASPRAFVRDGRLIAEDAATLPAACVVCGDSVDLVGMPTLRGGVRFSLCHEHLISAAARAIAGVAVLVVLAYLLVNGGGSRLSTLAISAVLMGAAAGLIASAVPVWTWRRKGSGRQLFRVGAKVREEIGRAAG